MRGRMKMFERKKKLEEIVTQLKDDLDNLKAEEQRLDENEVLTDQEWEGVDQQIRRLKDRIQKTDTENPEEKYKKKIYKYSHNFGFIVCLILFVCGVTFFSFIYGGIKVPDKDWQTQTDIEDAQKEVSDLENQIEESRFQTDQQKEAVQMELQERQEEIRLLQEKILNHKRNNQDLPEQ